MPPVVVELRPVRVLRLLAGTVWALGILVLVAALPERALPGTIVSLLVAIPALLAFGAWLWWRAGQARIEVGADDVTLMLPWLTKPVVLPAGVIDSVVVEPPPSGRLVFALSPPVRVHGFFERFPSRRGTIAVRVRDPASATRTLERFGARAATDAQVRLRRHATIVRAAWGAAGCAVIATMLIVRFERSGLATAGPEPTTRYAGTFLGGGAVQLSRTGDWLQIAFPSARRPCGHRFTRRALQIVLELDVRTDGTFTAQRAVWARGDESISATVSGRFTAGGRVVGTIVRSDARTGIASCDDTAPFTAAAASR